MKLTLFEIDERIRECVDEETGEILNEEMLELLEMAREEKIENVAIWQKETAAMAEAIKKEKMALAERQSRLEARAEKLKAWLAAATDGQKFQSARCQISFRKTKSVEIGDITLIPEEYLTFEPKADKKTIKDVLSLGGEVPGAQLIEKTSCIVK